MAFLSPIIALDVNLTGVNVVTSGTSAVSPLAVNSAGNPAKYVRVSATVAAHVRLGLSGVTAVSTDLLLMPGESVVLCTAGCTHIAAIQDTAAGVVNVSPIEWA